MYGLKWKRLDIVIPLLFIRILSGGADAKDDAPPSKPLTFKAPKDWQPVDAGPLSFARFQIGKGERTASASITALAKEGGGLAPNINRWRAQVGLDALPEQEVLKLLRPTKIDSVAGHFVDLTGPETDGKVTQRVVVAIVRQGEQTWFIRLSGAATVVEGQKSTFDGFLKSVRFEK